MELGEFSISLAVRDLRASQAFYAALGFEPIPGDDFGTGDSVSVYGRDWVVLAQGSTRIGLFQNMFENNLLTWTPPDVREVQRSLKQAGIPLAMEADEHSAGHAAIMLSDPDGNQILLDQQHD